MKKILLVSSLTVLLCSFITLELPKGWTKSGSMPEKYEMYLDKGAGMKGKNAATIKSTDMQVDSIMSPGFGTLMQKSGCRDFLGKRIIMKAWMKTKNIAGGGYLWLSIDKDGKQDPSTSYNMRGEPINGTSDWQEYKIEIDVPSTATGIGYGAVMMGKGQLWFSNVSFYVLDAEANADAAQKATPDGAVNLNFAE
jgi:hypothetical protein